MDDLISRQKAIEQAVKESQTEGAYGYMDTKSIVDMLNGLPTIDAVDVVRCKDCKYWDLGWKSQEDPLQKFCPMIDCVTEIDFYCAYAERETDE